MNKINPVIPKKFQIEPLRCDEYLFFNLSIVN